MSSAQAASLVINLTDSEPGFADEIKELGGEELLECIQCAKCAAACPMVLAGFSFFNKRIIQAILLGLREVLLDDSSIWACQSCNRCTEVCPREVNPFEIIQAMRRVAVREFALPTMSIEGLKSLYDTGHAVYLAGAGNTRAKVGLPEKPPSTVAYPEALKELQAIMRKTALADLGIIPMNGFGVADTCEV
ncbi:4Fe-4S dicluster domain-containing protein [Desulfofundulus thermosubterraneus]|uniref:CoB--CoM heterodisulfide reductase subunit C n=1 Tax=Desulfofundulus thermosubterraneus DSM 16057 TaxID=1121432 RepID=A0A1M6M141_9FIRM|nr:4Fe-4S dicluster domain-containing protein [Desulfofundulus thermosubterraneus]SHJ77197.1 CoB--CoM heterodisulfide reductase subunit C [Desulfofundulus thermosubterraneus DSM 16057]